MKLAGLVAHWENRLRAEGLAPLDGVYHRKTRACAYVVPQRIAFGVHSAAFTFEFFRQCEEFGRAGKLRWPDVWQWHSQGVSRSQIASRLGVSKSMIQYRVERMVADMRAYFKAQVQVEPEAIPPEAEVLEVFVAHQQRK